MEFILRQLQSWTVLRLTNNFPTCDDILGVALEIDENINSGIKYFFGRFQMANALKVEKRIAIVFNFLPVSAFVILAMGKRKYVEPLSVMQPEKAQHKMRGRVILKITG
jgi:hypothetical protein